MSLEFDRYQQIRDWFPRESRVAVRDARTGKLTGQRGTVDAVMSPYANAGTNQVRVLLDGGGRDWFEAHRLKRVLGQKRRRITRRRR